MKNTISKIILISILLLTSISFSQTLKNKTCDSLKVAYEAKFNAWISFVRLQDTNNQGYKHDSLYVLQLKLYGDYLNNKSDYIKCKRKIKELSNVTENTLPPPPPPPPPVLTEEQKEAMNEELSIHGWGSTTRPEIISESRDKMMEYVLNNYPAKAKKDSIVGEVELHYICNKEGSLKDIKVRKESPDSYDFGEIAIEAAKRLKYTPSKDKNGNAVSCRIAYKIYFNLKDRSEKCFSIKKAFEEKKRKCILIKKLMKQDTLTKVENDYLNRTYNSLWNEYKSIKNEYILCKGATIQP